jgi:hypothetical protein
MKRKTALMCAARIYHLAVKAVARAEQHKDGQ